MRQNNTNAEKNKMEKFVSKRYFNRRKIIPHCVV